MRGFSERIDLEDKLREKLADFLAVRGNSRHVQVLNRISRILNKSRTQDKVANCGEDGCQAAHHHLLHGALVQGRVMIVQNIGAKKAGVFLCREDVRVKGAGGTNSLHALYDWGATVTLVTHAAAAKAGLERKVQVAAAVAGLGGRCTTVNSYYMVPVIDGDDAVRVVRALGVDHIATLAAADVT